MIKKPKRKIIKQRKNPYIVQYGYHVTKSEYVDSILREGLKPSKKDVSFLHARKAINELIYNGYSPVYFLDLPDLNKIPKKLKDYFRDFKLDVLMKVDVEDFNQLADVYSLFADFNVRLWPEPGFKSNSELSFDITKNSPKYLKKYVNDDDLIPVKEFISNEELATETIFHTESFCINQVISPKYIKDIMRIDGQIKIFTYV